MRKAIIVSISMLFVVSSLFAQQNRRNGISLFVTDVGMGYSDSTGRHFDAAYGAAFDHRFGGHLSAELSVTNETSRQNSTTFLSNGVILYSIRTNRVYPIDATASYNFFSESRWQPHIGAGLRYVSDSYHGTGPLGSTEFSTTTVSPEVVGGVTFRFTPALGLRLDAKQILSTRSDLVADPRFKASIGLNLRF
jgi:outer membrane protein W